MVASSYEYIDALMSLAQNNEFLSTRGMDILRTHYLAPDYTISPARLSHHLFIDDIEKTMFYYDQLAEAIAHELDYTPIEEFDGHPMWLFTLCTVSDVPSISQGGYYEFILRPELVVALNQLKWFGIH